MKAPSTIHDKYCQFHRDHGHNIDDCIQLEIKAPIQHGYLGKFVHDREVQPRIDQPARQQANEEASNRPKVGIIKMISRSIGPGVGQIIRSIPRNGERKYNHFF